MDLANTQIYKAGATKIAPLLYATTTTKIGFCFVPKCSIQSGRGGKKKSDAVDAKNNVRTYILYSKRAKSKAIAVVQCMRNHVTSWKKGSVKVVLAQEQR